MWQRCCTYGAGVTAGDQIPTAYLGNRYYIEVGCLIKQRNHRYKNVVL